MDAPPPPDQPDKPPTKGVFKGKKSTKRGLSRHQKKGCCINTHNNQLEDKAKQWGEAQKATVNQQQQETQETKTQDNRRSFGEGQNVAITQQTAKRDGPIHLQICLCCC